MFGSYCRDLEAFWVWVGCVLLCFDSIISFSEVVTMLKLCARVNLIVNLETQILSHLPQSSKDVERPLLASQKGNLLDWISGKSCAGRWSESCHFLCVMDPVPTASELSHRDMNLEGVLEHHLDHPILCAAHCPLKWLRYLPAVPNGFAWIYFFKDKTQPCSSACTKHILMEAVSRLWCTQILNLYIAPHPSSHFSKHGAC